MLTPMNLKLDTLRCTDPFLVFHNFFIFHLIFFKFLAKIQSKIVSNDDYFILKASFQLEW